ncbi:acetylglutamate kinase [Alphaproteobacteria bacterium]|jgi:acetylglutamate kinase|nr:acetylglutamate kinase [Alphaproteobacteria bacterium]
MSDSSADRMARVDMLSEALPFMRRYAGETIVIKYGGHAMGDQDLADNFARDIVLLKQIGAFPIVVHGGGPQIGDMLKRLQIKSDFVDGLRVTGADTVEIVEMVLSGGINKGIVAAINRAGGRAIGLSGKDANLIRASKLGHKTRDSDSNIEKIIDLGFVGKPEEVNGQVLAELARTGVTPVIAPVGFDAAGNTYNINADTAAGAVASAVQAKRLLMLTDVAGVLDAKGKRIEDIAADTARRMINEGVIKGGMIPKIETCLEAVAAGVEAAVILDGRVPHAILLEIFTERGDGTLIRPG